MKTPNSPKLKVFRDFRAAAAILVGTLTACLGLSHAQGQIFATPAAPALAPAPDLNRDAAKQANPAYALRYLTNNIQGLRLEGEIDSGLWPIYVSDAQARRKLSFRVGYLSAVSVMPEASTLTVSINDVVIGATSIRSPNNVQTIDFDVPANLLQPGFNAVRISVDQRHRVDCSLAASYELWTQLDPSQTGLLAPGAEDGAQDLADLAALPTDPQWVLPIRAVLPGRTSPANIERIIRAAQVIATTGRFEQPFVDVGPPTGGAYGVNLVVGRYADIATIADLGALGPVDGPRVVLLPATGTRRPTLLITGITEDDVNRALAKFSDPPPLRGSEAGLRVVGAFPGYRVTAGQTIRLSDLGLRSQEFSGRVYRTGFNVIMPADFYSADYGKAMLNLAGGYAPGLESTAQVIVSVNGRNAVSAPLPRSSGDVFKEKELPLPLGYFRPGLNRIEIEAQLPKAAEDAACDPAAAIAREKRFLFLNSTQLSIPRLARIGRMPDLEVTANSGSPFVGGRLQPKLYVPAPDLASIGAAATLVGRMAVSAGRPIDFRFTVTPPPTGSGATLVVAPGRTLDDAIARAVGLDPELLRRAWGDRAVAPPSAPESGLSDFESRARRRATLQKNRPAACHVTLRPTAANMPATVSSGPNTAPRTIDLTSFVEKSASEERDLFAEWQKARDQQSFWPRWRNEIAKATAAVYGIFNSTANKGPEILSERQIIDEKASLLISQAVLGANIDDVWTLVAAPNSALLAESVNCLIDPRVWRHIDGRLAVLDASDGKMSSLPATPQRFIATQPFSALNVRLIAASWLSINASVYLAIIVAIAALLALATFTLVRNVGRRNEQ